MPLTLVANNTIAHLELPSIGYQSGAPKASAEVLLHGATIISWKTQAKERLFLSSKTPLDGSSAIRGGIPIVFPVFGSPVDHDDGHGLEKLPKHGVARTTAWKLRQTAQGDGEDEVGASAAMASFTLSSSDISRAEDVYPWAFGLVYDVTLTAQTLTTALHITDASFPSKPPMRFQTLLHNYLLVSSAFTASIAGLGGQSFKDKTDAGKVKALSEDKIVLAGKASDAVYLGPAPKHVELRYEYTSDGLKLVRSANMPNTTVWNPSEEGAQGISDMHPEVWKEFICIEPGKVVGFEELAGGKTFTASQTLQVI